MAEVEEEVAEEVEVEDMLFLFPLSVMTASTHGRNTEPCPRETGSTSAISETKGKVLPLGKDPIRE